MGYIPSRPPNRLLVVDDDADLRCCFREVAEDMGYAVAEAANETAFTEAYAALDPTAILLDLTMPGTDGVEFLRSLAKTGCEAPVILVSGQDQRVLATAERLGKLFGLTMHAVMAKPVSVRDLRVVLHSVSRGEAFDISPADLENALRQGEFVLHYQPKVDLQQEEHYPIVGGEALIRWKHPVLGMGGPDRFIPLAEQTGLIASLGEYVLDRVIAQIGAWRKEGIELPIAINVSPSQLNDLSLPDRIASRLQDAEIDPGLLVVEVTERAVMQDVALATDILTRLRLKNIAVSLDDFGAGYSSLVEMYRMPINELKLDRSLICDMVESADACTVVRALVALARELRLPVCAEGIETQETAVLLRNIGCFRGQGFFFSKPLDAEAFARLVRGSADNRPGNTHLAVG